MAVHFLWPWAWWGAIAVAVAAWAALRRPAARTLVVPSVSLWREAAVASGGASRRRWRAAAGWACLLAGALAGLGAISQPILQTGASRRQLNVVVCPVGPLDDSWPEPIISFLQRLDSSDQVRLVLPVLLGGSGQPSSPAQAQRRVEGLQRVWADLSRLELPPIQADWPTYLFALTTPLGLPPGAQAVQLPLRAQPWFERLGGEVLPDGRAQLLLATRNAGPGQWAGQVVVHAYHDASAAPVEVLRAPISLGPAQRKDVIVEVPAAPAIEAVLVDPAGLAVARSALVLAPSRRLRVAMIGDDRPALRRLIEAVGQVTLLAQPDEADVVVAVGVLPPADKPAWVVDPPAPPPGWEAAATGAQMEPAQVVLGGPGELTQHLDLSDVTLGPHQRWRRTGTAAGSAVLSADGEALTVAVELPARQVWLAFDPSARGSDLSVHESFVVLGVNILDWLGHGQGRGTTYEALDAVEARGMALEPLPADAPPTADSFGGGAVDWPWPGLYKGPAGELVAVAPAKVTLSPAGQQPAQRPEDLELPPPQPVRQAQPLWWYLAMAAGGLWLAGWALRR